MGRWQPIETAPKTDPTTMIARPFLAFCPDENHGETTGDERIRIVWWEPFRDGGKGCWADDRDIAGVPRPTHWQPLPAPPGEADDGASPRLLNALRALQAWCIPGMDWTDDIGQALLAEADAAIAEATRGGPTP